MGFFVRGYGRASTDHQVISTEIQESIAIDAFNLYKRCNQEWADAQWGGFFADDATCRLTKFRERNGGSLILAASQPGDIIICSTCDRIFGDLLDLCETLDLVHKANIGLKILDRNIDTSDDIGQGVFKILAVVAEMEVKRLRKRVRDNMAYRKRIGRPSGGKAAIGWKYTLVMVPGVPGPQRYTIANNADRRRAREILNIKDSRELSVEQSRQLCNAMGLKQKNGRVWTGPTFSAWCRAAERDFPLPNGTHTPAPIPADSRPYVIETISEAD